ncbi:MAG: hypothetical protein RR343_02795 [Oscillospiraceae bacterium]
MEITPQNEITLNVKVGNMDVYINKAKQYVELLKEANTLAEELASVRFQVEVM